MHGHSKWLLALWRVCKEYIVCKRVKEISLRSCCPAHPMMLEAPMAENRCGADFMVSLSEKVENQAPGVWE